NQTVFFLSGTDSLEVNDEVKEFSLVVSGDSNKVERFDFVNANQYKKEKDPLYYEVLADHNVGQLLKANKKFVEEGHDGLPVHEGKKVFGITVEYWYYDKQSKKITRIKGSGSNISQLIKLTDEDAAVLQLNSMDFNREEDLIKF